MAKATKGPVCSGSGVENGKDLVHKPVSPPLIGDIHGLSGEHKKPVMACGVLDGFRKRDGSFFLGKRGGENQVDFMGGAGWGIQFVELVRGVSEKMFHGENLLMWMRWDFKAGVCIVEAKLSWTRENLCAVRVQICQAFR